MPLASVTTDLAHPFVTRRLDIVLDRRMPAGIEVDGDTHGFALAIRAAERAGSLHSLPPHAGAV